MRLLSWKTPGLTPLLLGAFSTLAGAGLVLGLLFLLTTGAGELWMEGALEIGQIWSVQVSHCYSTLNKLNDLEESAFLKFLELY